MDWYLVGRILGLIFWPTAVAVVVLGIGWVVATPRAPHVAANIKRWFRLAAIVGFLGTLVITGRDFLKYAGVIT